MPENVTPVVTPAAAVVAPAVVAPAVVPAATVAPATTAAPVVAPVATVAPATTAAPVVVPAATVVTGAPEAYADFTMPEGTTFAPEVLTVFKSTAKELNLPQNKAQLVIDKLVPAIEARGKAAIMQGRADMLAAAKADKDIGGEKFDESVAVAKFAMAAYFTPEFAKFLNDSGLGNHPEMIRGLVKAGIPLKPDGWVFGGKKPAVDGSDARVLYPNSQMNA